MNKFPVIWFVVIDITAVVREFKFRKIADELAELKRDIAENKRQRDESFAKQSEECNAWLDQFANKLHTYRTELQTEMDHLQQVLQENAQFLAKQHTSTSSATPVTKPTQ